MHKLVFALLLLGTLSLTARAEEKIAPLDLKFTAVDGKNVDFAKLRGKVVLIDFWATWCPPCRREVPDVVAVFKKYHAKGFDVVGISLDQDEDTLKTFTQAHEMTWPQYFDGGGFEDNKISTKFGIDQIPTMVLLGKDGRPFRPNDAKSLDDAVAQALAAP